LYASPDNTIVELPESESEETDGNIDAIERETDVLDVTEFDLTENDMLDSDTYLEIEYYDGFSRDDLDLFKEVHDIRVKFANHVIMSHLNVNSVGSKISEIRELQRRCQLDILVLSETKLDASYKQEIIDIDGYHCVRQDKRANSGGLLTYISKDIPFSIGNTSICNDEIECFSIELNISEERIMLLCMYKNPRADPVTFKNFLEETYENISDSYDNVIIIGDLNFNMFQDNILKTIIPPLNLFNIIKEATCFKSESPTLIDVMLVTKRRKFITGFSKNTGISDHHNIIGGILRKHKPAPKTKIISFRNLNRINYENLQEELIKIDMSGEIMRSSDVNAAYSTVANKLCSLLDKHAPKKQKTLKRNDFHCMSKELRKAIYHRNKLRNKYYKHRTSNYLNLYKIQRNKVITIKRKEVCRYFEDKCKEGTKNKDFWKAVKPFFSKSRTKLETIPLRENNEIVTDSRKVSKIFNRFFQTIGADIGSPENNNGTIDDITRPYDRHPSVSCIKEKIKIGENKNFIFRFVSEREVAEVLNKLSIKKAAGYDELPAKFIKSIRKLLIKPLTLLVNRSIMENEFPKAMKKSNITPLYKKKDKLNKDNYRSVNLLPVLSKILEKIIYNQIYDFIAPYLHRYLSGFRKRHSCQDVLISMIEEWKEKLDKGSNVGIIAIDLSKAFDCMPHGLLIAKLKAYGFSKDACQLMKSYVMERQQRVKIGDVFSDWVYNIKGVPQGSIMGPLLFNIFINDLLFHDFNSKIYNYADDNTLSFSHFDPSIIEKKLKEDCINAMEWFERNNMKANANKFQVMFLSRNNKVKNQSITIDGIEIKASQSIVILGVELDRELRFNSHIDAICSQTGKQINALKRMKHYLNKQSREVIYKSYINCNFDYCSVTWLFANKTDMEKLEKTNKRALRVVTNSGHMNYEELCKQQDQLPVFKRCLKSMAVLIYKIKKGISPQYMKELIREQSVSYDMRDNEKLVLPSFSTVRFGKNSFRYLGAKLWNIMPIEIKQESSLNTFKSAVHKWLISYRIEDQM